MLPDVAHWEFVATDDAPNLWSWRRIAVDGSILDISSPSADFGLIVSDAMQKGFVSTKDHWLIKHSGWVTHFAPGRKPVVLNSQGDALQRRSGESSGRRAGEPPQHGAKSQR
jgi:hypothetical protein